VAANVLKLNIATIGPMVLPFSEQPRYVVSLILQKMRIVCVWQIVFGSGFKCNSAVWICIYNEGADIADIWEDEIHRYPVEIPDIMKIN
jgi:hypothetical protein